MKVALLISGHTRCLNLTQNSILEMIHLLKCDVFIHSWIDQEMTITTWRQPEEYCNKTLKKEDLLVLFDPQKIKIEACDLNIQLLAKDLFKANPHRGFSGAHYMIYGMWMCYKMFKDHCREKLINYDVVIRYRFDLACFDLDAIIRDVHSIGIGDDSVIMPTHNWANSLGVYFDGLIIASEKQYDKIMASLPKGFGDLFLHLSKDDVLFAELMIADVFDAVGTRVRPSKSSFGLIRKNGSVEQRFINPRIQFASKLISSVRVLRYKNYILDGTAKNNIDKAWRKNTHWLIIKFVKKCYPLVNFLAYLKQLTNFNKSVAGGS
jgi:hypothetical protein